MLRTKKKVIEAFHECSLDKEFTTLLDPGEVKKAWAKHKPKGDYKLSICPTIYSNVKFKVTKVSP